MNTPGAENNKLINLTINRKSQCIQHDDDETRDNISNIHNKNPSYRMSPLTTTSV